VAIYLRDRIKAEVAAFDEVILKAKSDNVAKELIRDKKRWLLRNDLFFLSCVTGHEKICEYKEVYQPFCDKVSLQTWQVLRLEMHEANGDLLKPEDVASEEEWDIQRLVLAYRAFYKTTIVTICHTAQLLVNYNNLHVVLCHNTQNTSSKNLVAVKNLFLNRPRLTKATQDRLFRDYGVYGANIRDLFPECVPKTKDWGSTEKFNLANRTDMQRPEHSIEAKGVDTEITGGHWQVAKKNDLVTEKSVNTEDQIVKTADWDARFNIGNFDDRKTPLQDYEGTRYHFADLYSAKKDDPKVSVLEIPIVKDWEKFKEGDDSQITHPQRYKRGDIESMLDDMWVFFCQMQLRPEDPAKKRFMPEMIKEWTDVPEYARHYLLVDPANEKKKRSDYTAMSVVGVTDSHYYLVDMVRDKLGPNERIDTAIDLIKRWGRRR
jgi:hypothetical protein